MLTLVSVVDRGLRTVSNWLSEDVALFSLSTTSDCFQTSVVKAFSSFDWYTLHGDCSRNGKLNVRQNSSTGNSCSCQSSSSEHKTEARIERNAVLAQPKTVTRSILKAITFVIHSESGGLPWGFYVSIPRFYLLHPWILVHFQVID